MSVRRRRLDVRDYILNWVGGYLDLDHLVGIEHGRCGEEHEHYHPHGFFPFVGGGVDLNQAGKGC